MHISNKNKHTKPPHITILLFVFPALSIHVYISGIARIGFFDRSNHCSAPSECRTLCCLLIESKSTICIRSHVFMRKLKSCTARPTSSAVWERFAAR
jgi:hypothetical protein